MRQPFTSFHHNLLFQLQIRFNADGCLEWQGGLDKDGYGRFCGPKRKGVRAHRWAYEHWVGRIPDGAVIDHLCRNRKCVNPEHLEAVSHRENVHRGEGFAGLAYQNRLYCKRGHERSVVGSILTGSGIRLCKQCISEDNARQYMRRRLTERSA